MLKLLRAALTARPLPPGEEDASPKRLIGKRDVVSVYEALLGRAPTRAELDAALATKDIAIARERVVASAEFAPLRESWPAEHPLVVFLHVAKTGGRSINALVREIHGRNAYWHNPRDRRDARRMVAERPELFRYVPFAGGHFYYGSPDFSGLGRPLIHLAVTREPVARAISLYNFVRSRPQHPQHRDVAGGTLLAALRGCPAFRSSVCGSQLHSIFGARRAGDDRRRRILEREAFVVGKLEAFDAFVDFVTDRVLQRPGLTAPHRNPGSGGYQDDVRDQPDYAEAVALLEQENAEERAFLDSFGELLVSAPMRQLLAARGRIDP